jgi:hypothetical protein
MHLLVTLLLRYRAGLPPEIRASMELLALEEVRVELLIGMDVAQ